MLRAGIIVGHRTLPIAVADVVRYLVGVLEVPPPPGARSTIEGRTNPRLSAHWLSLVTDVDLQTGRSLIDSMSNEVVLRDDSIRELVPFEPMDDDAAVLTALGARAKANREKIGP